MSDRIVFVDEDDTVIGSGERTDAFAKGIRHRIARVFLWNSKNELLIARRSLLMSTNPGMWGESVAGHVDEGEDYLDAAIREMQEEVGASQVPLTEVAKFYYEMKDEKGGLRNRWNKLFVGNYDGPLTLDPQEVSEVRWISPEALALLILEKPGDFTAGLIKCFELIRPSS